MGDAVSVTILDSIGLPVKCGTESCHQAASTVWSSGVIAGGHSAGQHYACDEHNPMSFTASLTPICGANGRTTPCRPRP